MLERFGVTEETWREGGRKDQNFLESESPLFGASTIDFSKHPEQLLELLRTGLTQLR